MSQNLRARASGKGKGKGKGRGRGEQKDIPGPKRCDLAADDDSRRAGGSPFSMVGFG